MLTLGCSDQPQARLPLIAMNLPFLVFRLSPFDVDIRMPVEGQFENPHLVRLL